MFKNENDRIRQAVLDAVEGKPDELLNRKPSEDAWSPIQILDHLQLMETMIAKNISKQLASEKNEKVLKKPIALTVSRLIKVDAPRHVIPTEEFVALEEMKKRLTASRTFLYSVYDGASKETLEQKSMPHPVFGKVPLSQWFPFVGLHEKRHLKQLEKTLKRLS
ncbi:DinB family protein [Planomicrobium soli]|uniref:DinB family protein n=1 Tax=Planomicrobium soli TaxID=1176648 RepID=A0A2P8H4F1_9BACL|nr:DinB family protein [Planomicrobium soli]PSL41079.1 DinB family protein [Planomicrobium soli]